MEAHVELCARCARSEQLLTDLAGEALASLGDAPVEPGALDEALSRIKAAERTPAVKTAPARAGDDLAPTGVTAFKPWRWAGPGIQLAQSRDTMEEGWKTFLLKVEPRRALPTHGHQGDEWVCVLQGGFSDGERRFWTGDFAAASSQAPHRLTAEDGAPCICIVATQAPLEWRGLARWLQPLIGV